MEIKAAEISSVIKEQIANFETKADVAEVGTVLSLFWKCWREFLQLFMVILLLLL